jgi:ATP/maltotriose-dependent transcriptional regulator MalT/DNA-binding SARP family transcriptional activator
MGAGQGYRAKTDGWQMAAWPGMAMVPPVVRTKIIPPRTTRRTLVRPRLLEVLGESLDHRLTILHAGAGYGKSTALASFAQAHQPFAWYQVSAEDSDPLVFLPHLCRALEQALPGLRGLPIAALEGWKDSGTSPPTSLIVDQILNALSMGLRAPTILAVDDAHLVVEEGEVALLLDRLIGLAPPDFHVILASRRPIHLPSLSRWQAQGEVLILDQGVLAFSVREIDELFSEQYGYQLTPEEVEGLWEVTEGWAIALHLIWQGLRSGATPSVRAAISHQAVSTQALFDVLAREVLGQQPQEVQAFLRASATLRVMTAEACDAVRQADDSETFLAHVQNQDLLVVDLGQGHWRYHPIFRSFLEQLASPGERARWHRRAAAFFQRQGDLDAAVYHMLQAHDFSGAADILVRHGATLLASGRLDSLATYLDSLPPQALHQRPELLHYLGDLARLHSRFHEALGWYQQAERLWRERGQVEGVGRALRGQARVYLDTVNPSRAEELLQQALRLSDGTVDREAQARLYELLAENKLNAGKPEEAERLQRHAASLRREGPQESELLYRVLLRTGRLREAREKLIARAEAERQQPARRPRAHRETLLLLSLIHSMEGEAAEAYRTALEGTRRGEEMDSPFVTAVGHMRQGHALMLLREEGGYRQARAHFELAVAASRGMAIPRLRVEACWGLTRAYGYRGDLAMAGQVAREGLEIAGRAGDEWIASLIRVTMGAALALAGRYGEARSWLGRAAHGFEECSDPFGRTVARLWLSWIWFRQGDLERLADLLPEVLSSCRMHGYDCLFTRATLLGPPSERALVPLLILARQKGWEAGYAARLLAAMGLPDISLHPGYQLRILTLGEFQVRRGAIPVGPKEWRREKARQLFQLLITYRDAPLDRDQILEHLWPGEDPESAQRGFKVALSTLLNVLEPERSPGSESAYILRQGSIYGLRPEADLWIDAQEFVDLVRSVENLDLAQAQDSMHLLERAVDLYRGEYLPDARYQTWAAPEREHLMVLFLRAADRLCAAYLEADRPQEALDLADRILGFDNCWERAYRHLMRAYSRLGDHGQVARTYRRCVETLQKEMEVQPAPETQALYRRLLGGG